MERIRELVYVSESDIRASFGFSVFQRHDGTRKVIENSDLIYHVSAASAEENSTNSVEESRK